MEGIDQVAQTFTERSPQDIYSSADHDKKMGYFYNSNKVISTSRIIEQFFRYFYHYNAYKQQAVLSQLLVALKTVTTNAYVLTGQSRGKNRIAVECQPEKYQEDDHLIAKIVDLLVSNVNNKNIFNLLQQIFEELLPYSKLQDSIAYQIISKIAVNFHQSKVKAAELYVASTVIKNIYHAKIMAEREPNNMLVFHGSNNITIEPLVESRQLIWMIKDGYSLFFWINLENIKSSVEASLSKLFTFYAPEAGGLQSYLIDNKIYYRIIGPKYTQPQIGSNGIFLGELQAKKWTFIGFEHEGHHTFQKSKLKFYVNKNKPIIFTLDPPKILGTCLTKYTFFDNIYCKTSSICLFPFLAGQEGIEEYNKNINSIEYVKNPKALVFENRQGKVYERSGFGVSQKYNFERNLDMNFEMVLPLFYLLRFQQKDEDYPTLNELFNIFILFLRKSASAQSQAIKNGYFKTISQLICETKNNMFDENTIKSILHIKHTITDTNLLNQYFSDFLWPLLHAKIPMTYKEEILQIIKNAFSQNLNHNCNLIGLDQMINLLQIFEGSSLTCCEMHYKIAAKKFQKTFLESNVVFGQQKKAQNYILGLIEVVLANSKQNYAQYIYKLIRLLCLKYSPCFILDLMSLIRKSLTQKMNQKGAQNQVKEITKYLHEKKVHFLLIHLIENQFFAEIKAESVKLIYSLLLKKTTLDQTYISNLISKSLWKINEFIDEDRQIRQEKQSSSRSDSPAQIKEEKQMRNQIIEPIEQEEEQQFKLVGPQAPALSNRLKGKKSFDFGFVNQSRKPKALQINQEQFVSKTVQVRPKIELSLDHSKKSKKFALNINTESINQMFTFGGQKGQQLVISESQQQMQLDKIIKLAKKCVMTMKGKRNQVQFQEQEARPAYVPPPMTTKNKVAANKKNFNLNLIEQVEQPEVKLSTPVAAKKSIKTPTSVKSSKSENVFTLYNSLLQSCLGVNFQSSIITNSKIQVVSILGIFFKWIPQTDLQTKFLNDLEIILQSSENLALVIQLPELYDFLFELCYKCLLFQEMKEKRVYAQKLQNIIKHIFTYIYKEDIAGFSKFAFILNWIQSKKDEDYQPKCLFLTSRYALLLILECIEELLIMNNQNNPIMQRNFQSLASVLDTIKKIVPTEFDQVNVDNYERVVFTADFELPLSLVPYFKSQWADYILYQKYLFIFKRFYCTEWYNKGLNFFESKDRDFLSFLMQSNSALMQKQATYYIKNNFLVSLIELQRAMLLQIQHNQPKQAEQFGNEAVWQTILLVILVQMYKQKNIKSQRSEIILAFLKSCKLLAEKGIQRIVEIVPMLSVIKHYLSISNIQQPNAVKSNATQILDDIISNYIPEYLLNMDRTDLQSFILNFSEVWIPNENHYKKVHSQLFLSYKQKIKKEEDFNFIQFISNVLEEQNQRKEYTEVILQANERVVKNNFRKLWSSLRIYNPIWRHPSFKWQQDVLFQKNLYSHQKYRSSPFFNYKIAKHTSKGKGRFFLKLRLTEPAIVSETIGQNEQSTRHRQYNLEKALTVLSQKLVIGVSKKSWIVPKGEQGLYFVMGFKKVRIINTLTTRSGHLALISDNLVFISSKLKQKTSHLAIDQYELRQDKTLHKYWPLEYIKQLYKRRYVNRKKSIQINFINGKSVVFDFENQEELEQFCKKIMKLKNKCINLAFLGKNLEPKKLIQSLDYTKKWTNLQISTFDYLMEINTIAGRAYSDLTQYPVFPWTMIHFEETKPDLSNEKQMRNLALPMGANGSEDRIHNFEQRYQIMQMEDQFATKFHYGTHYSSPGIIYHFLVRLEPYTRGSILLQSGKFDFADRLFDSWADSYKNAISEYSDVRELVPELYCLPEAYLNINGLDLGVMQNKKRVHNVGLPEWAKQNPYLFIYNFRKCLEEENVGRNINNWIDLIFGYKQRGDQSIKALNCFYYLTYEDVVPWEHMKNEKDIHSVESQIVNFGQTPSQIFIKPHPQRNYAAQMKSFKMICDPEAQARVYRPSKNNNKPNSPEYKQSNPFRQGDESIIYMKWVTESKLAFVRKSGDIIFYKCVPNTNTASRIPFQCTVQKEKKIQKLKKNVFDPNDFYDPSLEVQNFPMEIIGSGHTLCLGGLSGGKLTTIDIDTGSVINGYHSHQHTISCMRSDLRENFLITGDIKGNVIMWEIKTSHNVSKLVEKKLIKDQYEQISSIYYSLELQCFAVASFDGSVLLYNSITGKKLRAYYHPKNEVINEVVICSNPLAAVVMFCNTDNTIYSFSINGQLIARHNQKQFTTFFSPIVLKDSKLFEYVAFGSEKSEIHIKSLPFLEYPAKTSFKVAREACVNKLCVSKFNRFLVSGCSDGDLTIITDPNTVANG